MGVDHRRNNVLIKCSTQTIWFEIFLRMLELRVGIKSRPYKVISIEVMKLLMKKMELSVKEKVSMLEMRDLTKQGAYFMSCFVASLRGSEEFMMDEAGL